jgi:hypothetical protein
MGEVVNMQPNGVRLIKIRTRRDLLKADIPKFVAAVKRGVADLQ